MKKVLVLGGSGFVSGTVAHKAVSRGHEVWCVTRGAKPLPPGAKPLTVDRKDRDHFAKVVRKAGVRWDVVIDCIGFTADDATQDSEVLGPLTEHIVFVSTDFVYSPGARIIPQREEATAYNTDPYGWGKRQCEEILLASPKAPTTVLRPCHIYGPGSWLGCLPEHGRDELLVSRIRTGEPLRLVGGGHFLQQPIYVGDLAQVLLETANRPVSYNRVANVAGPDIVRSADYYRIVGNLLGRSVSFAEIPVEEYRAGHPGRESFLDHRVYDLSTLTDLGLPLPSTKLSQGLTRQVTYLQRGVGHHWDSV